LTNQKIVIRVTYVAVSAYFGVFLRFFVCGCAAGVRGGLTPGRFEAEAFGFSRWQHYHFRSDIYNTKK